ncbi:hypothetical protein D6779_10025, partial [Candidatus Parcubacteria bacterium]
NPMAKVRSCSINSNRLRWLLEQPLDIKLAMLQQHLEICRLLVNEILEDEVNQLTGPRYSHQKPHKGRYYRWGYNPGSIQIGDEKVRLWVPRVYDKETHSHVPLKSYKRLKALKAAGSRLLKRVLLGLSIRDYRSVVQELVDSFGLSPSSVSRRFIEESAARLAEFMNRDLSAYEFVALFIDGKYLAKEQIIIALGVTITGDKIPLAFIQSHSENTLSIKELLTSLIERGFNYQNGLLCVIDGSKAIRKAICQVFGKFALIQRCRWHKRENVLSYLNEEDQQTYRRKLNQAYQADTYQEAKQMLLNIKRELMNLNVSAANSLEEGLEETLTLHRLGINHLFSKSFATTNCLESLNSHLNKYLGRVKYWKNSPQRHRWIACALLDIEQRMRKVDNYKKLYLMQQAIQKELNLHT